MTALHPSLNVRTAAHWGQGITRRAIRLRGQAGKVEAALEDHCHAMLCTVEHDGSTVTAIDADFRRYTLNHCPGALAPLRELVGMPVDVATEALFAGGRARRNCTHMLDLAWLALRHVGRGLTERLYEIEIPDAVSGPLAGVLRCDGEQVLSWTVEGDVVIGPERYAGRPLWGGFLRWLTSESQMSQEEQEYALVLHKGFFMVGARRLELRPGPRSEDDQKALTGVCFGYGESRVASAIGEEGMFRDFSQSLEKLLRFE